MQKVTSPDARSLDDSAFQTIRTHVLRAIASGQRTINGARVRTAADLFAALDRNGDGSLGQSELELGITRLDAPVSQDDVQALIATLDRNANGTVDVAEFVRFFEGSTEPAVTEARAEARPEARAEARAEGSGAWSAGTKVEARYKGGPRWYSGEITFVDPAEGESLGRPEGQTYAAVG